MAWVIIGKLVSLSSQRLAATAVAALWVLAVAAIPALADGQPDSTWVALGALPHQGRSPIFALAVDPTNNQLVLAGNSQGSILRSPNAGVSWTAVHSSKSPLVAISFSPYLSGLVLAGTRGDGALVSRDGGSTWSVAAGLEGRAVRVFAFSLTTIAAGTDRGVYTSTDGASWSQSTLSSRSIDAIAFEAIHTPVRLVAGSDAVESGSLPLFQSVDGGASWTTITPPLAGTTVVRLNAGPLPPTGNVRPLLVGTNSGLYLSTDNGATFNPLSGGSLLPATDYTQISFITDHFDRFYVASDGGGSKSGGLWRSDDEGQSFRSLQPPQASVTALAVSNDEQPTLFVASFQPSNQVASLWIYHDTGGPPQGPPSTASPVASGARGSAPGGTSWLAQLIGSPTLPYVALGVAAVAVLLAAAVAQFRGRHR